MTEQNKESEERVLVLAPVGRDAALTCKILAAEGILAHVCRDLPELCSQVRLGAGVLLLTEEAVDEAGLRALASTLEQQDLWSDLPVILFTATKEAARFFLQTGGPALNLTILERPISIAIVVSAVRSALRARSRQYQMRDLFSSLASANRAKDEFLATISHELRTPLNAMLGWVTMLRSGRLDAAGSAHAVEVLDRNVRSQAKLVADLLDVSRIISGKIRLDVQPVDLVQVIHAAIDVVRPAAEAKSLRLQVILDPSAGPVSGDPARFQQVVWNLLSNAVKFTERGGRVRIDLARLSSQVQIVVSDSGCGISPEFLPYVFDRFRQADGTLTRRNGGMGLGLAIVRHLVELQGGTISAFSQGQDMGSTFTLKLPLMVVNGPAPDGQVVSPGESGFKFPPRLDGLRLLIVEDDPDARELLMTIIENHGAELRGVASAREAINTLDDWKPDLLVSDIEMPEEDGYSLIRRVRSAGSWGARVPAVALTAHARVHDRLQALSAGFDAHIAKPVEPAELITVIASLARHIVI
jgi:signal transduction histidine kinase